MTVKVRNSQFASISSSELTNFRERAKHYGLSTEGLVFSSRNVAKGSHFYYEFPNGLECRVAVFSGAEGVSFKADTRNGYIPNDSMVDAQGFANAEEVNGFLRTTSRRRSSSRETDGDAWVLRNGAPGMRLEDLIGEGAAEELKNSMPKRP